MSYFDNINAYASGITGSLMQLGVNSLGEQLKYKEWKKRAEDQAKYNKEFLQYQYDMQQKAIDQQNLYNSPAQQMERFKEAGLNPNLIYNQGNPGNQSSAPKPTSSAPANYQAPVQQLTEGINVLKDFLSVKDMLNKTRESSARASLYDSQVLSEDFKRIHLMPLSRAESIIRNIGLGYDNYIKESRLPWIDSFIAGELGYQNSLASKAYYDSMIRGKEFQRWNSWNDLQWETENYKMHNIRYQREMYKLDYDFTKWANARLKSAGIIPGINSSNSSSSSHGIKIFGTGGQASTSANYSGPLRFKDY